MERKNLWNTYDETQRKALETLNLTYRKCLDAGKTERECVRVSIEMAKEAGYRDMKELIKNKATAKPGDKLYMDYMEKALILFEVGETPLEEGMNILGAHIDSPRIDIKQNPLFEDQEMAFLDTHYYGGIKKYQWVTLPLALHGVVIKKDGTKADIVIGEEESDPIFMITDLLPHLAYKQLEGNADKFLDAEKMDLLVGNKPEKEGEKDMVKAEMLRILKERYDIEEEDFLSAELEIVPAGKARDCGLDRSMIAAYGQDDRVCAFTSLLAMLKEKEISRTSCCILIDKEEIGSTGASGMTSKFFENAVAELITLMGEYNGLTLRRTLANSKMLSSDVSAAYDPMFGDVYEKNNAAFFAYGPVFNKYTGKGGKGGSNDANPEYIAQLRKIMDDNQVRFQTAELGKVDIGGGGTIAYLMAVYGMEVIDSGVAVLCMHAPWEITSKADIFEAVKGYEAFLEASF